VNRGVDPAISRAETFQLHAEGRTKVVRETRRIEDVNEEFEQIHRGEVDARLAFDIRSSAQGEQSSATSTARPSTLARFLMIFIL
jgi:hypothetical protein